MPLFVEVELYRADTLPHYGMPEYDEPPVEIAVSSDDWTRYTDACSAFMAALRPSVRDTADILRDDHGVLLTLLERYGEGPPVENPSAIRPGDLRPVDARHLTSSVHFACKVRDLTT